MFGGWQRLHPNNAFQFVDQFEQPYMRIYSPEIFMRKKAAQDVEGHLKRTKSTLKLWT